MAESRLFIYSVGVFCRSSEVLRHGTYYKVPSLNRCTTNGKLLPNIIKYVYKSFPMLLSQFKFEGATSSADKGSPLSELSITTSSEKN
jgi:hypothetical protein